MEDRWNEGVLGQVNNQVLIIGLAHERRYVYATSKGAFARSETNFTCVIGP